MHNTSFADDAFMRLIWGRTARDDFDRGLAKDFSRRRAHVQKGIAPGVRDPVGMTLAYIVDTAAECGTEGAESEQEEHLPGTDVGLFKEFMAMLNRVRTAYRERDSRFYRECWLTTALTNLREIPLLICPRNIAGTATSQISRSSPSIPSFSAKDSVKRCSSLSSVQPTAITCPSTSRRALVSPSAASRLASGRQASVRRSCTDERDVQWARACIASTDLSSAQPERVADPMASSR